MTFFVVGESGNELVAVGTGETIQDAIKDWSEDYVLDFPRYNPKVFQGNEIKLEMEIEFKIKENPE